MADYYSILDKTISGLPSNTPEIRNAVYKKARSAIETQLRNMNPAPSEEAVVSQLGLLEEAIVLIDSEHGAAMPPAVAPLPPIEPEPVAAEPAIEMPITPAQPVTPTESVTPQPAPVAQPAPTLPPATMPEAIVQRVEDVVKTIPEPTVAVAPVAASVGAAVEQVVQPQMAEAAPIAVAPATANIVDPISNAEADISAEAPYVAPGSEQKKSGGFFSGLIKLLVTLGILGGAGFALWKNKDALPEPIQEIMNKVSVFTQSSEINEPIEPVETVKVEENITPEPEVKVPEPVVEPEVVEVKPEAPVITEPEVVEPAVVEPEIVEPEVVEPTVIEPAQPTEEVAQADGSIAIGEVAYLYEEGSAGSGATRTNAAVTWTLGRESLGTGLEAEPVIFGKMDIPERGMSLDIKINRNVDQGLSASHLIEIGFTLPNNFSGKSVESIARFVMKATEEAPGEPLVAVPVKAGEAKFLIALDNLPQAVSVNTQLLRDAGWIDVPLIYGTGKRALITLEKGGTGERVFKQAFQDWQNR